MFRIVPSSHKSLWMSILHLPKDILPSLPHPQFYVPWDLMQATKPRCFLCHLWEMAIHVISVPQCLACRALVNLFKATKPTWKWDNVLSTLLSRMGVFNVIFLLKLLFLSCTSDWKMVERSHSLYIVTDDRNQRVCHSILHSTRGAFDVAELWDQMSKWNWFTLLWMQSS